MTNVVSDKAMARQSTTGDVPRWGRHERVIGGDRRALARELAERYADGEPIRDLAVSIGRSYGFVHRVLSESGVPLRSRGGSRPRRTRRPAAAAPGRAEE